MMLLLYYHHLLILCVSITCLVVEDYKTESEELSNSTLSLVNTMSSHITKPLTSAFTDFMNNQLSIAQPRRITQKQKATREQIQFITEEYDYYGDEDDDSYKKSFTLPTQTSIELCPYDRCKHLQIPCSEIQKSFGGKCLCPGISAHTVPPDSPQLLEIRIEQTFIGVNWCSPLSTVTGYRVLYGDLEGSMEMGPLLNQSYRFFALSNLFPGKTYRVCIVAINDAGESKVDPGHIEEKWLGKGGTVGPCGIFNTYNSHGSYIYLVIGITLAILTILLFFSVFIYCFYCKKRNRKIRRATEEEMGVTNMSFKADSVENL
ncbi:LRRN4 C-terminal-like protein isoform X2 [Hyperolius riggenbachi]|uniref:LRRN4 C-terminal-like protein isoform X2 n=1 Tax=Hyperolius riggenbachi TaxID=752182 RepID=UPI0035A32304